ncbi:hypothetical protein ACI3EY_04590 [Ornithinimicrobium sp. LYQ92]|uniref:hypothetical protein n=1 Tax=Serinicoccus sp. LYQ92 TaxID=3378798 RepID=UPI003852B733
MSFGNQQPVRRSGLTTAGKWMFIIGLVLSLITGAVVAWGAFQGASLYNDVTNDTSTFENGEATVAMEEGDSRFVVDEASGGDAASCTVSTPDGTQEQLSTDSQMGAESGTDVTIVGSYAATTSGEHTFACEGGSPSLSPNISSSAIIGIGVAALGVLALIPLVLLTVIGLIMWLVGRGRDRRAQQAPVGGGGYPGQGGYGAHASPEQAGYQGQAYPQRHDAGPSYPGPESPYQRPEDDTRR